MKSSNQALASAEVAGLPTRTSGSAVMAGQSSSTCATERLDWSALFGSLKPSTVLYPAAFSCLSALCTAAVDFSALPAIIGTNSAALQAPGANTQLYHQLAPSRGKSAHAALATPLNGPALAPALAPPTPPVCCPAPPTVAAPPCGTPAR